jgi:hypothetical protein
MKCFSRRLIAGSFQYRRFHPPIKWRTKSYATKIDTVPGKTSSLSASFMPNSIHDNGTEYRIQMEESAHIIPSLKNKILHDIQDEVQVEIKPPDSPTEDECRTKFNEGIYEKLLKLYDFRLQVHHLNQQASLAEVHLASACSQLYVDVSAKIDVDGLIELLNMAQFYDSEDDFIIQLLSRGNVIEAYCIFRLLVEKWAIPRYSQKVRLILLPTLSKLILRRDNRHFAFFLHFLLARLENDQVAFVHSVLKQYDLALTDFSTPESCERILEDPLYSSHLADLVINLALYLTTPLLAASLCVRFHSSIYVPIYVPSRTLHKCMEALIVFDADKGFLHFKALSILANAFPRDRIHVDAHFKRQMINSALQLCRHRPPPFINDVVYFALSLPGDKIPTRIIYHVLEKNIANEDIMTAVSLWNLIKDDYDDITNHGVRTLSALLYRFSKEHRLMPYAREIANKLRPEFYGVDGIAEALLMYCARDENLDLASEVCKRLNSPVRRTVLTSLLHLHLVVKDEEGAEKILREINSRKLPLQDYELAVIIKSLAVTDTKKAIQLLEKLPEFRNSPRIHAAICSAAIDRMEDEVFYTYFEKLWHVNTTNSFGLLSQMMAKKINSLADPNDSRRLWLYWTQISPRIPFAYQVQCLRLFLTRFCSLDLPELEAWVLAELELLGVSKNARVSLLKQHRRRSDGATELLENDKRADLGK